MQGVGLQTPGGRVRQLGRFEGVFQDVPAKLAAVDLAVLAGAHKLHVLGSLNGRAAFVAHGLEPTAGHALAHGVGVDTGRGKGDHVKVGVTSQAVVLAVPCGLEASPSAGQLLVSPHPLPQASPCGAHRGDGVARVRKVKVVSLAGEGHEGDAVAFGNGSVEYGAHGRFVPGHREVPASRTPTVAASVLSAPHGLAVAEQSEPGASAAGVHADGTAAHPAGEPWSIPAKQAGAARRRLGLDKRSDRPSH